MSIGQKIKQRRTELGWSQRDLAERMGYNNNSTIARIENGKVDIPQSRIVKFAEILNTSIAYLMGWEDEEKPTGQDDGLSEEMVELIDCIKKLPEAKIQMLLQVARSIR